MCMHIAYVYHSTRFERGKDVNAKRQSSTMQQLPILGTSKHLVVKDVPKFFRLTAEIRCT